MLYGFASLSVLVNLLPAAFLVSEKRIGHV